MQAKPTFYGSYMFRSRLEARWAVFFDTIGFKWAYEPQSYRTMTGPYLPDFQVINGERNIFFEIKPKEPSAKETTLCMALAQLLSLGKFPIEVFLCYGSPGAEVIIMTRESFSSYWRDENIKFWADKYHEWYGGTLDGSTILLAQTKASTYDFATFSDA